MSGQPLHRARTAARLGTGELVRKPAVNQRDPEGLSGPASVHQRASGAPGFDSRRAYQFHATPSRLGLKGGASLATLPRGPHPWAWLSIFPSAGCMQTCLACPFPQARTVSKPGFMTRPSETQRGIQHSKGKLPKPHGEKVEPGGHRTRSSRPTQADGRDGRPAIQQVQTQSIERNADVAGRFATGTRSRVLMFQGMPRSGTRPGLSRSTLARARGRKIPQSASPGGAILRGEYFVLQRATGVHAGILGEKTGRAIRRMDESRR